MRHFQVVKIVRDEHWVLFHDVALRRGATIDQAWNFLSSLGYKISRGAVWKYLRAVRDNRAGMAAECGSRAAVRRKLAQSVEKLGIHRLAMLANYAEFLASSASSESVPRKGN